MGEFELHMSHKYMCTIPDLTWPSALHWSLGYRPQSPWGMIFHWTASRMAGSLPKPALWWEGGKGQSPCLTAQNGHQKSDRRWQSQGILENHISLQDKGLRIRISRVHVFIIITCKAICSYLISVCIYHYYRYNIFFILNYLNI